MLLHLSAKKLAVRHSSLSISLSRASPLFESWRFAATQRVVKTSGKSNASFTKRKDSIQEKVIPDKSSKAATSGPTMRMSRFYRVAQERGFAFAIFFYIFGEAMTLSVLYILHCDVFGSGDAFSLLRALSFDRIVNLDRLAQVGPTIWGVQLSPRLLLNYITANAITYPFYRVQLALCAAIYFVIHKVSSPLVGWVRIRRRGTLPKAPSSAGNAPKQRKSHSSLTR